MTFFKTCVTSLALPGLDPAQVTAFIDQNAPGKLASSSGTNPAILEAGGVHIRISDDAQTGAAELAVEH
ncbi:hypothetical protein OG625_27170 [Streptomyces sp. NBC_01351]|uniref:hypothetical protein n=1 Tax=Streptomyces sp. NBC_01351 TaxID=2903833 RepID=UPI002E374FBA|nr:hypothetical protein [Streptomyces sp. NBC_01351]